MLSPELIAKIKSKLDAQTRISPHYSTLFKGLKVNHPRKAGLVHPLAFFAFRIVFLALAITLVSTALYQALLIMILAMCTLAFSLHDQPWQ